MNREETGQRPPGGLDTALATEESATAPVTRHRRLWMVASLVALVGMIGVNGLANALPLNGLTTGAISDSYPILFVPAGYVFSIWGLIYLALIAFAVTQAVSPAAEAVVGPVRPWFVLSCLANGAWIFAWHYLQLGLSVVLMLTLLGSLIAIYRRMHQAPTTLRPIVRWSLFAPISLYLGWICVATIPNIAALLVKLGWSGQPLSGASWAALMMVAASAIVLATALRFGDPIPPLVVVWALVGIMVKVPDERAMRLVGGMMVLGLLAGVGWIVTRRRLPWRAARSAPRR